MVRQLAFLGWGWPGGPEHPLGQEWLAQGMVPAMTLLTALGDKSSGPSHHNRAP